MPGKGSKYDGPKEIRQQEHVQVLGELQSIDRAVGWLCNMVQVLENKIDIQSSTIEVASGSRETHHQTQTHAAPSPTPDPLSFRDTEYCPHTLSSAAHLLTSSVTTITTRASTTALLRTATSFSCRSAPRLTV